jgi:hypothetical protein
LIRPRIPPGPQAGLRPAGQKSSLIDLLPLSQFASLTLGERFVVHALDSSAARNLADAPILGLLPPDVGLILLENEILLEFSSRPFDPIEFGRMIGLADQVAAVV